MTICNECGNKNASDFQYCIFCGTHLSEISHPPRERIIFFLTPAIILVALTIIFWAMGIPEAISASSSLTSDLIISYLIAAALFAILCFLGKIRSKPNGYWFSGITSVALVLLSTYYAIFMLNLRFGVIPTDITPDLHLTQKYALEFYAAIIAIISAAFATAVKYSILKYFLRANLLVKQIILRLPLILLITAFLGAFVLHSTMPHENKIAIKAQILDDYGLKEHAIDLLDKSLEQQKQSPLLSYLYAAFSIEMDFIHGNKDKALTRLEYVHQLHPESVAVQLYLSQLLKLKDDKEMALRYALQAANKQPDNSYLNDYLGNLYFYFQELEQAVEAYKKSLSLSPRNPIVMNNLAFALLELEVELFAALELSKESVKLLPNQVFNKDTLAWAYYKNQRYNEALETINLIRGAIESSDEINFHYIMILHSMSLIKHPIDLLDKILASPEAVLNPMLFKSVTAAKAKLTSELKVE